MQRWETVSAFYYGYVCGDFHQYYEWDIYDVFQRESKNKREYRGTANQKSEILDGEYVKDDSTGEWRRLDGGAVLAGGVYGFWFLDEDVTWHDRLANE